MALFLPLFVNYCRIIAKKKWTLEELAVSFWSFSKGQLISKCPYEKSVWTKYQRKYFCPGSLLLQGYYKTESIFLQTEHTLFLC